MQLRAVEIEGAIATLARRDLRFEIGEPAPRDLSKGESRRERQLAHTRKALEQLTLPPGLGNRRRAQRAKARPTVDHDADRVPPIALLVDAALNTMSPLRTTVRCHRI